ncbi:methyl-accepting chemotaxis protein [Desulfocucumis palustris]|uniref:Methyl-accepting chemotaxis protein n=1 Tax=Desulfocucumis palustris TaxID=1898651 RepID=A0A2L2XEM2_9FIRM|nr:methyl-accepting chemotaxis protein [Desulfocucumis palustris]GBF34582.1 methyl-accepting chemotaxis protein [Desulfocucumis palustris]
MRKFKFIHIEKKHLFEKVKKIFNKLMFISNIPGRRKSTDISPENDGPGTRGKFSGRNSFFSIKKKLMAGFFLLLLFNLVLGSTCYYQMVSLRSSYNDLLNKESKIIKTTQEALMVFDEQTVEFQMYLINFNSLNLEKSEKLITSFNEKISNVKSLVRTDEEKKLLAQILSQYNYYIVYADKLKAYKVNAMKQKQGGVWPETLDYQARMEELLKTNDQVIRSVIDPAQKVIEIQDKHLVTVQNANELKVKRAQLTITLMVLAMCFIGFGLAIYIAGKMAGPIVLMERETARIAAGDLRGEKLTIESKDELGLLASSFNIMLTSLREIAVQLKDKSQLVAVTAKNISTGLQDTAGAFTNTAAVTGMLSANAEKVGHKTRAISLAAREAAGFADKGSEGIKEITRQMEVINTCTNEVSVNIRELSQLSRAITDIVDFISDIAAQTQLLSLNAAIEAARAGEQGRGFGVVAEEVRNLANKSTTAAKDIYRMINSIQHQTGRAVEAMNQGVEVVDAGTVVVNEVGELFSLIIKRVQNLVAEIEEMAGTAGEIALAVKDMAAVAEKQAGSMAGASESTETFSRLAGELDVMAGRFRTT